VTGFPGALQFLTRIPIRSAHAPDIARSVPWFPVVGALIGLVVGLTAAGASEVLPAAVAATIAVLVGVALTGALHEDGLADMADALGGSTPAERREILHDSRHGSFGVAAMTGTILLRVACAASLSPAVAVAGFVAAHSLGRAGAVGVMAFGRPAPGSGLGADSMRDLLRGRSAVGVVAGVLIAALVTGWWIAPLAGAVTVGAAVVTLLAMHAFEGVTGDVLGAVEQVGECLVLVVVSGLALHHRVWWS
jgi:adenosylcobinamide-GDP ribazoletransferase